eukprot:gb/GECG01005850.1/.p1 GENE.gb/GECG01005850.1/~~gb/GECG01005850.1/.p1  ORF type:complete len:559 (+),score=62.55 gb/GECG01005850.1/:1-1677(+)
MRMSPSLLKFGRLSMPQWRCSSLLCGFQKRKNGGPERFQSTEIPALRRYNELIEEGYLQYDERQVELLKQLHRVCQSAGAKQRRSFSPVLRSRMEFSLRRMAPKLQRISDQGVYVYGGVGIGKTMCMDIAIRNTCAIPQEYIRRSHFHSFMLDIHARLHRLRTTEPMFQVVNPEQSYHSLRRSFGGTAAVAGKKKWDPLGMVAEEISKESSLLAFDEFQVTDVADAMILRSLFSELWSRGVTVICTSNRCPDDLYEQGLNRELFLPFISLLKTQMRVLNVDDLVGPEKEYNSFDYRMNTETLPGIMFFSVSSDDDLVRRYLQEVFSVCTGSSEAFPETIRVAFGRHFDVQWQGRRTLPNGREYGVAWFTFEELCCRSIGAADYLALTEAYQTIILENVPQLDISQHNEARRFITFIDTAYEFGTRVILTSGSPLEKLFVDLQIEYIQKDKSVRNNQGLREVLTSSGGVKLVEKRDNDLHASGTSEYADSLRVAVSEGNKSSNSEQMLVSAGELSGMKDTGFAFHRAASRLQEMQSKEYQVQHVLKHGGPSLPSWSDYS